MNEYLIYLLIIALMLSTFTLVYIRAKRGAKSTKKKILIVRGGNISLFFNKAGNLVIIPYVKDKYGSGKATAHVDFLNMPFGAEKLGSLAKKSLNGCINDTPCSNKELLEILGVNDWKEFSEGRKNISLYFREAYGLVFNTTTRKLDGAYQFNYNGIEYTLPPDCDNNLLGSTLLKLVAKCR